MQDENSSIKVVIDGTKHGVEGSLKEYRKRKEFKKPSIKKKEKVEAAAKRKAKDKAKFKRYYKI